MRVLRIDVGADRLELHPFVTILRGLSPELRQSVVDTLAGVPRGSVHDIPLLDGIVEAHGVFLDLTDDTLSLLDLRSTLDVVVRAGDLPDAGATPGERAQRDAEHRMRAAEEARATARAFLERAEVASAAANEALAAAAAAIEGEPADAELHALEAPRGELEQLSWRRSELERTVDEAKAAHANAVAGLQAADDARAAARDELAAATRQATAAAAALERAREDRDPFAASAVEAARERLAELEGDVDPMATPDDQASLSDGRAAVEQLQLRRAELESARVALDFVDPYTVEVALAQVLAERPAEPVPSEEAQTLADEWRSTAARLADLADADPGSGASVADARRRLERARAAVFEAEQAVRVPELGPGEGEAIEAAHQAVLDAAQRAERRFSGAKAIERFEEAREAEQAILDRLGFLTYTDFVMGTSNRNVEPRRASALDAARAELAAAEAAWSELEAGTDVELSRAALVARQRELRDRAAALTGGEVGDDIEWSLRTVRIPPPSTSAPLDRLRIALERAGVVLDDDDLAKPFLIELATVWLAEQRDGAVQRAQIERELSSVDAELGPAMQALRDRDGLTTGDASGVEIALVEARTALVDAEARHARSAEVEEGVEARKADLEASVERERAAGSVLADADSVVEAIQRDEHLAHTALQVAEAELASTLAAEHDASRTLAALERRLDDAMASSVGPDLGALEAEAGAAADELARARVAVETADAEVDRRRAEHQALSEHPEEAAVVEPETVADEIEWYLLARIAAQRSVSYAGSVPLVLDDALHRLEAPELERVMLRLERMSAAVQVIVLTDDPAAAYWADEVGPDRAAAVAPERVPT